MRRFEGRHRTYVWVATAAIVLAAVALVILWSGQPADEAAELEPEEPVEHPPGPEQEPSDERGPLSMPFTGVPTDEVPDRPPLLVKVSNSPEARPQTGLDHADVVFEELTEGGITRFVALFHSHLPDVVGPVRSARPIDIEIASGFGRPGFAYSGAREEVRGMLLRAPIVPITEGAPGFFRDDGELASNPVAPHDLFLRVDPALATVTEAGARPTSAIGWVFTDEPTGAAAATGSTIEIVMSPASRTGWTYEPATGGYRRTQSGVPFDVTGHGHIAAANVVVLQAHHYIGPTGYPETSVIGTGDALVLRDGHRYAARWSKPTGTDPLAILTADGGAPFPLKPGPTWIHLPDHLPEASEQNGDG